MTHQYTVTGMTCGSCESKVENALTTVEGVVKVNAKKDENLVTITMENHVPLNQFKSVLPEKYTITNRFIDQSEAKKTWFQTYKPVLMVFFYITGITFLLQFSSGGFNLADWMRHFMAGFFITFSFFKMLNLKDFAMSYQMYDVVAKRFKAWGYIYAFTELGLGIAFLLNLWPFYIHLITFIVMSISIIGAIETVANKKKIQCACLGAVFDLPMSNITIIEDGLMIVMSGVMLFQLF